LYEDSKGRTWIFSMHWYVSRPQYLRFK
jgi:hypothetical protein